MGPFLENIVLKARQIKDMIVTVGPSALDSVGDVFGRLQELSRYTAQLIRDYGPMVQFAPGRGFDNPDYQRFVSEIDEIVQFCEKEARETPPSLPAEGQAGLLDRLAKMSPEMKQALLSLLGGLLTKVLLRAEMAGFVTPAQQQRASERGGREGDAAMRSTQQPQQQQMPQQRR